MEKVFEKTYKGITPSPFTGEIVEGELVEIFKISPNLYFRTADYHKRGECNSAFIVWENGVCVIDPSTPQAAREMLEEIDLLFKKPVRSVILTHNHGDHADGMPVFYEFPIPIFCAYNCVDELASKNTGPAVIAGIRTGLELQFGSVRAELRPLGDIAHSPTDMIVRFPAEGIVCTGDFAGDHKVLYFSEAHVSRWITKLYELSRGGDKFILPGHGSLYPASAFEDTAKYLEVLQEAAFECIERFTKSGDGISPDYDSLNAMLRQYLDDGGEKAKIIREHAEEQAFRELSMVVRKYLSLESWNGGAKLIKSI